MRLVSCHGVGICEWFSHVLNMQTFLQAYFSSFKFIRILDTTAGTDFAAGLKNLPHGATGYPAFYNLQIQIIGKTQD